MKYDERIVFFIDILGFKNLINSTVDKKDYDIESKIDSINEILSLGSKILNFEGYEKFSKSKIVTQFSDSFVISFLVNERSELFYTLSEIQNLIINFVKRGILVRGGIAIGKLVHTDTVVFGPGLIKAYETECRAAIYPRIILDSTVIERAIEFHAFDSNPTHEKDYIMEIVTQDTDNLFYIDYFEKAISELDEPELDVYKYIEDLIKIIEPLKDNLSPDIKVKIGWLKNKVNLLIELARNENNIEHLKKSGYDELAEFCDELITFE